MEMKNFVLTIVALFALTIISCNKENDFSSNLTITIAEQLKNDLYSIPKAQPNPKLEAEVREFKLTANLNYIKSGIKHRVPISYPLIDFKNNLINSINLDYSSGLASTNQTNVFVDSMLIPKQGTTFNENSAAYALDYLAYTIKKRFQQLSNPGATLTYINLNEGEEISGLQKFYVTTVFGTYDALPPVVFPDIQYSFMGYLDGYQDESEAHSVLQRAVNNHYGIQPVSSNVYFSDFTTVGVKTPGLGLPNMVYEVDLPVEIGWNPNFIHQDCIIESKILNRPMYWRGADPGDWTFNCGTWGAFYNAADLEFFYDKALSFFNEIRPSGFIFLECKMGYTTTYSSIPFPAPSDLVEFMTRPYVKYDCVNKSRYQFVSGGEQAYYGIYAKVNYRTGPSLPPDSFSGDEPNIEDYF